jgi:hypothetical protein
MSSATAVGPVSPPSGNGLTVSIGRRGASSVTVPLGITTSIGRRQPRRLHHRFRCGVEGAPVEPQLSPGGRGETTNLGGTRESPWRRGAQGAPRLGITTILSSRDDSCVGTANTKPTSRVRLVGISCNIGSKQRPEERFSKRLYAGTHRVPRPWTMGKSLGRPQAWLVG